MYRNHQPDQEDEHLHPQHRPQRLRDAASCRGIAALVASHPEQADPGTGAMLRVDVDGAADAGQPLSHRHPNAEPVLGQRVGVEALAVVTDVDQHLLVGAIHPCGHDDRAMLRLGMTTDVERCFAGGLAQHAGDVGAHPELVVRAVDADLGLRTDRVDHVLDQPGQLVQAQRLGTVGGRAGVSQGVQGRPGQVGDLATWLIGLDGRHQRRHHPVVDDAVQHRALLLEGAVDGAVGLHLLGVSSAGVQLVDGVGKESDQQQQHGGHHEQNQDVLHRLQRVQSATGPGHPDGTEGQRGHHRVGETERNRGGDRRTHCCHAHTHPQPGRMIRGARTRPGPHPGGQPEQVDQRISPAEPADVAQRPGVDRQQQAEPDNAAADRGQPQRVQVGQLDERQEQRRQQCGQTGQRHRTGQAET